MPTPVVPLDLAKLAVHPLASRVSLCHVDEILIDPDSSAKPVSPAVGQSLDQCAEAIRSAKSRGAAVMLIYGAHLLRNGAARILSRLMEGGWITHLATNGAGTIHDWEFAWFGASTESVEMGVAGGTFGTWHETATNIHLAMMTGALDGLGYGQSLGRFITHDGCMVPSLDVLKFQIAARPDDPLTAARADLLQAIRSQSWPIGEVRVTHRWKHASIVAEAYRRGVPLTVHPGIGYDIIANHPCFSGAAIGRGADLDFKLFGGSVDRLDGGVVLSIGSAIMGPQVFEKSISCVNNLRLQAGRSVVSGHSIFVIDLQDGGGWDWTRGEPPKSNPAYYLRFCKSFSRMGGAMSYVQADNSAFVHGLWKRLSQ
jgi:hypothetical protein